MPKWKTSEMVLKADLGSTWDPAHVRVAARSQQIMHMVNKTFPPYCEKVIEDAPQVIDLPFKCIEGDLIVNWCYWAEGMGKQKGIRSTVISGLLS